MKTMRTLFQACLLGAVFQHTFNCEAQPVTNVAAGANHSLFLKSDGSFWGMGDNITGQLGTGNQNGTNRPIRIETNNVVAIAGGGSHTMFLKSNGSLWVMGNNGVSQLGDGNLGNNQLTPEQIESGGVTAVAAGSQHSLYIKGGGLWVMGRNGEGQLGRGNYTATTNYRPERVVTSGVTAIAAGYYHSLFLKNDGSLWAMGDNRNGQFGNGTNSSVLPGSGVTLPEQIVNSNVVAIAGGQYHTLLLKNDGSLWTMGNNSSGQLGIGTLTNTNRPVQIVASNVIAIAAGANHSLFTKNDGSLWGMGQSGNGLLGTNATSVTSPIRIVGNGVAAIAGGGVHSLFVKSDGSLWAMGGNGEGQLGDGGNPNPVFPEVIVPAYNRITGELLGGGNMRLSFQGDAGTNYVLERTFNLTLANWVPQATNLAAANGSLVLTNAPNPATNNFWRTRSVP